MKFTTLDELRTERNKALLESDYLLLEDAPIPKELYEIKLAEIKLYRQQLRDLPQRAEELGLENIVFPSNPL